MRSWFLATAAVAIVGVSGCATAGLAPAAAVGPEGVRFRVTAPAAERVSVAGTFNGWSSTAHPMRREPGGEGRWATTLRLPAGEYQFMFVIDGRQWIEPPLADAYVDDGFGTRNAVVVVRTSREEP